MKLVYQYNSVLDVQKFKFNLEGNNNFAYNSMKFLPLKKLR